MGSVPKTNKVVVFPKRIAKKNPTCEEVFLAEDNMFTPGRPGLSGQGLTLLVVLPLSACAVIGAIYGICVLVQNTFA